MNINNLLINIKTHFGVDTDGELAASLGVSHQVVAQWRNRGRVPLGKLAVETALMMRDRH